MLLQALGLVVVGIVVGGITWAVRAWWRARRLDEERHAARLRRAALTQEHAIRAGTGRPTQLVRKQPPPEPRREDEPPRRRAADEAVAFTATAPAMPWTASIAESPSAESSRGFDGGASGGGGATADFGSTDPGSTDPGSSGSGT
jgi:hypothetical protein